MTLSLTVDLPPEPDDRAVVLDRDANAWQRRDDLARRSVEARWCRIGAILSPQRWSHLLVDHGPLTRLVTETDDRWTPIGAMPSDHVEEWTDDRPSSSPEPADMDLPRHWREGDPEPEGVTTVRDGSSEAWERETCAWAAGNLTYRWRCTTDYALGPLSWEALVRRGPLVEPTGPASALEAATVETAPEPDVAQPAACATGRSGSGSDFLRRVGSAAPLFDPQSFAPSPRPRAVRDEPQA